MVNRYSDEVMGPLSLGWTSLYHPWQKCPGGWVAQKLGFLLSINAMILLHAVVLFKVPKHLSAIGPSCGSWFFASYTSSPSRWDYNTDIVTGITNWVCDRSWGNGVMDSKSIGLSLRILLTVNIFSNLSCIFSLFSFSLTVKRLSISNRWNCFPSWLPLTSRVNLNKSFHVCESVSLPVKWSLQRLSHGLLCGWNDVMQTKLFTQCGTYCLPCEMVPVVIMLLSLASATVTILRAHSDVNILFT